MIALSVVKIYAKTLSIERRNSVIAFFTEFDRYSGRLCHSGWR